MADDIQGDNPERTDEKPKKSSGLIGQIVLATVLGTVAFGTVFLLPEPAVEMPVCPSVVMQTKEPEIETPSIDEISFVELDPLLVSLGKDLQGSHLKIGITLEAGLGYDGDVTKAQPKLRDAFTAYLRAVDISELEDPAAIIRLRSQLLRRAEVVLGPEVVHGVLITDFIVR